MAWLQAQHNKITPPPFHVSYHEELFDYMDHHADSDKLFSQAMDSVEALTGDSFSIDFDWGRFGRLIDVGGSRGTKSLVILQRHPHLTALVVDRAQVIAEAQVFWAKHPAPGAQRLHFQVGDLLSAVPPARDKRDIYLVCAVLHGFDDDTCIKALGNLARASGSSGARVAVMEMVLPEVGADLTSASLDMQMFMGTRDRERTLAQWESLLARSGMALEEVVGLQSFGSILVTRPRTTG